MGCKIGSLEGNYRAVSILFALTLFRRCQAQWLTGMYLTLMRIMDLGLTAGSVEAPRREFSGTHQQSASLAQRAKLPFNRTCVLLT